MNDDLPHGTPAGPSQDEPLETALREHYLAIGPAQSARPRARISNALDRRSARRGSRLRLLPALAGLTAVAALAGVATAPLWLAPAAGPAGATSSAVEAPASAEPSLPQQTEGESAPLNWDRLQAAQADRLGRTAQGDLWFLRQSQTGASTLAISSDAGASWVPIVLDLPTSIPPTVSVLDPLHAWSITTAAGTTDPYGGQGPSPDHLFLQVDRTSDGGKSWQHATVPGDYADSSLVLTFADSAHGYLVASYLLGGSSTVLATTDGGATWSVVTRNASVGPNLVTSDDHTLWAGGSAGAKGQLGHPFEVSRDGGRTWSDIALADLAPLSAGMTTVTPAFSDAGHGLAVVKTGDRLPRVYRTADGGRTWSRTPDMAASIDTVTAVGPSRVVATQSDGQPLRITASDDGGATWRTWAPTGLPDGPWIDTLAFADSVRGAAIVVSNGMGLPGSLFLTSDGGRSWRLAGNLPATAAEVSPDADTARQIVDQWETFQDKGNFDGAWALLSPTQQQLSGPKETWIAAVRDDPYRSDWSPHEIGQPVVARRALVGDELYLSVAAIADVSHAVWVPVHHPNMPGVSASSEILVVAPLRDGGAWRIWIVH